MKKGLLFTIVFLAILLSGCQGFSTNVAKPAQTAIPMAVRSTDSAKYRYMYSNAAGGIYNLDIGDGWTYVYFEGKDTAYCEKYNGTATEVTLPVSADNHNVEITKMTMPYGQIKRIDVPEKYDYITEKLIGPVLHLSQGCVIVVHNPDAKFELPRGDNETVDLHFAGYPGSTTEQYAKQCGRPFIALQ